MVGAGGTTELIPQPAHLAGALCIHPPVILQGWDHLQPEDLTRPGRRWGLPEMAPQAGQGPSGPRSMAP